MKRAMVSRFVVISVARLGTSEHKLVIWYYGQGLSIAPREAYTLKSSIVPGQSVTASSSCYIARSLTDQREIQRFSRAVTVTLIEGFPDQLLTLPRVQLVPLLFLAGIDCHVDDRS